MKKKVPRVGETSLRRVSHLKDARKSPSTIRNSYQ
jgi:hypothetical protein